MNVQHRILNKVFYQFINWRSEAISLFDVRCSKNALLCRSIFSPERSNLLGSHGQRARGLINCN